MDIDKETRILEAATTVFLRYGYRRTTMGDLAAAAGMSRPALYIQFCNKERIFERVCLRLRAGFLEEIRSGMAGLASSREKLRLAFEIWAVRPFSLTAESPDARDLFDASPAFARETLDQGAAAFEALIAPVLAGLPDREPAPDRVAHLLTAAVRGFKASARTAEDLRGMIDGLLQLTLA